MATAALLTSILADVITNVLLHHRRHQPRLDVALEVVVVVAEARARMTRATSAPSSASANFRTGGDLNDFFHGWLNYQIERPGCRTARPRSSGRSARVVGRLALAVRRHEEDDRRLVLVGELLGRVLLEIDSSARRSRACVSRFRRLVAEALGGARLRAPQDDGGRAEGRARRPRGGRRDSRRLAPRRRRA